MISTRFGTPIKSIVRIDLKSGWADCVLEDGRERTYQLADLKADNGLKEIVESAKFIINDETQTH